MVCSQQHWKGSAPWFNQTMWFASVADLENFGWGGIFSTKPQNFGWLHQNWEWFFGRNRKFERFFRPQSGGLQKKKKKVFTEIESDFPTKIKWSPKKKKKRKKKKRSSTKLRVIFRPKSEIRTFFPPTIRWSPKKKKVFTEIESDLNTSALSVRNFSWRQTIYDVFL